MFSGRKRAADASTPAGRPPSPRHSVVQRAPFEHTPLGRPNVSTPIKAPATPLTVTRNVSTRAPPAEVALPYSMNSFSTMPIFVKDALAHVGDAITRECASGLVSLSDDRAVGWVFVPELEMPSGDIFAARAVVWDVQSQKKLHDVMLPSATTAALVLVVDTPAGLALLAATPQGRVHCWMAGASDGASTTAHLAVAPDDTLVALVAMEGVGPIVVGSRGQHFVLPSLPSLAAQRVWRPTDSNLASLGRRFSSLLGFGAASEPTAIRAAVGNDRLWIAHERGVQVWQRDGDTVVLARDVALVDARGHSLVPTLPGATIDMLALGPAGADVFVLVSGCTDDASQLLLGRITEEAEGPSAVWKTVLDVEGVLPVVAPSLAVLADSVCVSLPARAGPGQLWVCDTSDWSRSAPLVLPLPDETLGLGTLGSRCVVSTRLGLFSLVARTVDAAPPVPAVFIPSDREPALVRLGQLFAQYCIDPASPAVDLDLAVNREVIDSLSREVANAPPKQDPRWAETTQQSDSSVLSSQIILEQLGEKLARHRMLLAFLRRNTVRGQALFALGGLGAVNDLERIQALMALRNEHVHSQDLALSEVISRALEKVPSAHTVYQEVGSVESIIVTLSGLSPGEIDLACADKAVVLVAAVSRVLELMVTSVDSAAHAGQGSLSALLGTWLYSNPVRAVLLQQTERIGHFLDSKYAEHLLRQAHTFATIGLSGLQLERSAQFETECKAIIRLFERHRLPWAFAIGETFECLGELARLCDAHDQARRVAYSARFGAAFDQALFTYYMESKKAASVLQLEASIPVTRYLDPYADLAWIKHIEAQAYDAASAVLGQLCDREDRDLRAKQTLLSLATLTAAAAGTPLSDQVATTYELLEYQSTLGRLAAHQGHSDISLTKQPLAAADLALRFADLGQADGFTFALEVTYYIPDAQLPKTVAEVLARAIQHDAALWLAMKDPERVARNTVLYTALTSALANGKLKTHLVSSRSLSPLVLPVCARAGVAVSPAAFDTVWRLAEKATAK
eukprot:m.83327 g.83327  ORF g.83327 m.83327 type:complete len:1025 (+) comp13441_c0_seq3:212-3286(+)